MLAWHWVWNSPVTVCLIAKLLKNTVSVITWCGYANTFVGIFLACFIILARACTCFALAICVRAVQVLYLQHHVFCRLDKSLSKYLSVLSILPIQQASEWSHMSRNFFLHVIINCVILCLAKPGCRWSLSGTFCSVFICGFSDNPMAPVYPYPACHFLETMHVSSCNSFSSSLSRYS